MFSLEIKKNVVLILTILTANFCLHLDSFAMPSIVHKQGGDVFKRARKLQQIYSDVKFSDFKANLNDLFLTQFRNKYEENFDLLSKMTPFLQVLTSGQINEFGYQFRPPLNQQFAEKMAFFYDAFDLNIPEFVNFLRQNNFSGQDTNNDDTVKLYSAFAHLLMPENNNFLEEQALFALANRFFEYCFETQTVTHYQDLLSNAQNYPIGRFLNAVLWAQFIGNGWKHWHQNCLDFLKERYDKGNEIVYLVGGTDIYQLLQAGIYKIRVIDPFLPSKDRYLTSNYMWLLKGAGPTGGIGDEISMAFEKRHIILKREGYAESEDKFFVQPSADEKIIEMKKSLTTWKVCDLKNNVLGSIVFERRLVDQSDFNNTPDKTIVISYGDIAASVAPEFVNGQGIDPSRFADDTVICIKQLRKPVAKATLSCLRVVSMVNLSALKLINLAAYPS